ncbi:hypothetical protein JIN84_04375 [Luteolibacter yonseiensis]|uniref:Uncharacterized protein n=1 Tax=Luteolibacter yonseiensis TaxID=1144680 RepID=A0A934V6B1_9BACT|nr:hypothetical protein [Luteolibacter yonseiensis]MBK1814837.1 hypothetical protein [Luteolibacter yonseiensis]
MTPLSFAGEVLESLKTRGGREYFKVEVLTNDDVGIRIRHEAGTARVPYGDLPDAVQSKYRAEWKKAVAVKSEATKAEGERIRQEEEEKKQAELADKEKPVKPRLPAKVSKPVTNGPQPPADDKEIKKLDAYIADLKIKASEALAEAAQLRRQADSERSRTRRVTRNYGDQTSYTTVPDKSGWAKATKYDEQAAVLESQAEKARALILEARGRREEIEERQALPIQAE